MKAWSPEQIARRLPIEFPGDESMRISHEAIYQALYVQARGHSAANSSPVFEPAEHLEYRGLGHVIAAASSFRRSC